jgi:hypothetical protein
LAGTRRAADGSMGVGRAGHNDGLKMRMQRRRRGSARDDGPASIPSL